MSPPRGLMRPVARRALEGRLDQLGRDAHARAVDLAPALAKTSAAGAYFTSMPVSASTSSVASCTRRQASSSQIVRRAAFMSPLLALVVAGRCRAGWRAATAPGFSWTPGRGSLRRRRGRSPPVAHARRAGGWTRAAARGHAWRIMNVQQVYDDGLCMQCGTCVARLPGCRRPPRLGSARRPPALGGRAASAPTAAPAWRRARARASTSPPARGGENATTARRVRDFLGPWRSLWFGWASDPRRAARRSVRRRGHGAARRRAGVGLRRRRAGRRPGPAQPPAPPSASSAGRRRRWPRVAAPSTTSSR